MVDIGQSAFLSRPGSDPGTAGLRTEALRAGAVGTDERGNVVKPHPFMGLTFLEDMYHYVCSEITAVMHRPDGKKLPFLRGHLATNIKQDVEYLEQQLVEGHPFIRRATDAEIQAYNMRTDPKGTMEKQLRPQIEAELTEELTAKIRAQLEQEMGLVRTAASDGDKIAGTKTAEQDPNNVIKTGNATIVMSADKQAEADAEALKKLAAMRVAAQRPPITPVSTADIAEGAAGSGT